jgi:hypothetical protein
VTIIEKTAATFLRRDVSYLKAKRTAKKHVASALA